MGHLGRFGSAARGIHFRQATGAQAIVQLGMAFGVDREVQKHGDVLVSSSLIPYDCREIKAAPRNLIDRLFRRRERYLVDYTSANRQPAREALVQLFLRHSLRNEHTFRIHVGALLSGSALIKSSRFRDELRTEVPGGGDLIIGGEMEGIGLLSASDPEDPVWCVVKGISDFADRSRDDEIKQYRPTACRNAAGFVLDALANDAKRE